MTSWQVSDRQIIGSSIGAMVTPAVSGIWQRGMGFLISFLFMSITTLISLKQQKISSSELYHFLL
jgi:hypothetical protein